MYDRTGKKVKHLFKEDLKTSTNKSYNITNVSNGVPLQLARFKYNPI